MKRYLRRRRRKRRLYEEQNGLCYYCGKEMKYYPYTPNLPDDAVTFEHLHDKMSIEGQTTEGRKQVVLACYKCNHSRGCKRDNEYRANGCNLY